MVFSSLFFLYAFLPVCLIAVWLAKRTKTQNVILLVASLFFYAWGEPIYVLLLILTSLFIWIAGRCMARERSRKNRKIWLVIAVTVALISLGVFKYAGLFVSMLNVIPFINLPVPEISLPIGISFYTFQALTYIIDLYRGEIRPQRSFFRFLLYVSLFPQLIAGPIVRYSDIERQLTHREITLEGMHKGLTRFLVGLSKKVLIANYASEIVEMTLETPHFETISSATAILGIVAFSIQIYFDFSGYSDMAIGLGHMFGFEFRENFRYPFVATSLNDYWRRWHISLSSFFRDYLYIPLGGNRRHHTRNMFIVWLLTGLWHGAHLNFILWGIFWFVMLALERWLKKRIRRPWPKVISWALVAMTVMMAFTFFYFTDFSRMATYFQRVFAPGLAGFMDLEASILWKQHIVFLLIATICGLPIAPKVKERYGREWLRFQSTRIGGAVHVIVIFGMLLMTTAALATSTYNPFLYFRF